MPAPCQLNHLPAHLFESVSLIHPLTQPRKYSLYNGITGKWEREVDGEENSLRLYLDPGFDSGV
jgi:hypothetical protein